MKILAKNEQQLLNIELPQLLKIPAHLVSDRKYQDLRTMNHTVLKYLNSDWVPLRNQTADNINLCLQELDEKFQSRLVKLEKIMIINTRPTCIVELTVLIEDAMLRFTKQELEQIIEILDKFVPFTKPVEEDDEQDETTEE